MLGLILYLFLALFVVGVACSLWSAWDAAPNSSWPLVRDQDPPSPEERAAAARRYRRIKRGW